MHADRQLIAAPKLAGAASYTISKAWPHAALSVYEEWQHPPDAPLLPQNVRYVRESSE